MVTAYPQQVTVQISFVTCCNCGMVFGMPDRVYQERLKDHKLFYCPAGHEQLFRAKSEVELLREAVAAVKDQRDRAVKQKEWAERGKQLAEHDAKVARSRAKAAVTIARRQRQRLKSGACPCCDEVFADLKKHMDAKHPRYR